VSDLERLQYIQCLVSKLCTKYIEQSAAELLMTYSRPILRGQFFHVLVLWPLGCVDELNQICWGLGT